MALKHLILARLTRGPAHGYELHREPLQPLHEEFGVTEAHIYASLRSLEKDGYVRHRAARRGRFPERIRYSITPAGRKYIRAWAKGGEEDPPEAPLNRSLWQPLAGRLSVAAALGLKPRPDVHLRAMAAARRRAERYRSLLKVHLARSSSRLLLRAGLALENAGISWLAAVQGEGRRSRPGARRRNRAGRRGAA